MNNGKYMDAKPRPKAKTLILLVCAALILALSAGTTLAYVIAQSGSVENFFMGASVAPVISNDGQTLSNNGDVPVYIRAMVIVNWMDGDGNVYGKVPECEVTANTGWQYDTGTGMYYYGYVVDPKSDPIPAPATVVCGEDPPASDCSLVVEVVAEAIQAEGMGAKSAMDAWEKAATGN